MTEPALPSLRYVSISPERVRLDESQRALLDRVNAQVTGRQSVEQIIDLLFETTRAICPCDRIGIAFLTDDQQRIRSHYVRADYEPIRLGTGYVEPLGGSSLAGVIESGRCRILNDLPAYLEAKPESRSSRLLVEEGVRSSMTCPLYVDDRVVGVLFRSSRQIGSYDEKLVAMHLSVAGQLSQAVEKVHIIDQLRQANRAYGEMLGFVSHELKSPVSSMITDATVLTEGYAGELTDRQRDVLGRLIRKGHYLLNLVREYLDLARIESGQMSLRARQDVDFAAEVVEPAIELVAPQIEQAGAELERDLPDSMPPVECDAELMKVALVNYLSNAVKYGRAEQGRIRLTVRREADGLGCAVWNAGPGFPPGQRQNLFRKFSRLSLPEFRDRKGTGVGLFAVWQIARLHGGRCEATSQPGQWACFELFIPQPLARAEQD